MSTSPTALQAFQTASGVAPDTLSLVIRTFLLAITLIWAAWYLYGQIHYYHHHGIKETDVVMRITRVMVVLSIVMVLVYIS